jgi:hypothetical protein
LSDFAGYTLGINRYSRKKDKKRCNQADSNAKYNATT